MNSKLYIKTGLFAAAVFSGAGTALAQTNCTANAGGNAIVCDATTTLTGGVSGTLGAGNPNWTFVSGPVTPVIASPNALTTGITGMTADGNYVFQLSKACGTGTAQSQVTITAHPRPASFTAGPDKTGICATTGTTTLDGVIPAGFTGQWRTINIYSLNRFGTTVTTNAQFSSTTVATPTFSLVNKANHDMDPAYYAILKITSNDGICSYEDTTIVQFVPNAIINPPLNTNRCISPTNTRHYFFLSSAPYFATNISGSAGTVSAGTTVSLNVVSQPAGGNISFSEIQNNIVFLDGVNVTGTYVFTLTVTNSCDTFTTPNITYVYTGTQPHLVNFQPTGHGAPEQLMIYSNTGSGGEVHCGIANTSTPENFYFSIDPSDPPTVITTVSPSGVTPPGGYPTVSVSGAGTYNRVAVVTPPTGGWQIGTYKFNITTANADGSCGVSQSYYIHISDNSRPALAMPDISVCYPGTGAISATISLPAVYKGAVNNSYFQDLPAHYDFTVLSKPAGSATLAFTTRDLRTITHTSTVISNLSMAGDYVFRITAKNGPNSDYGPFLEQEYACSNTAPIDTFTIHVESPINSNAGSDQAGVCANTVSLLGNAPGAGTGLWTVASAPAGATPVIASPSSQSTPATGLTQIGQYLFAWTVTTPLNGCASSDTVSFTVTCAIPVPVGLSSFTATRQSRSALLQWTTLSETNNKGFGIERSTDGAVWHSIGFVNSRTPNGSGSQKLEYNYTDKAPRAGTNYYRLRQTDFNGKYNYSAVRQLFFDHSSTISIYPNPAKDYVIVEGLGEGASIKIYDATGRPVKEIKPARSSVTIPLDELSEGLYQVFIIGPQGDVVSQKMMKLK